MKQSSEPGINSRRFNRWITRFSSYRDGVTRMSIEDWLNQFKDDHKELAARVLDSVLFINHSQIANSYRSVLRSLTGWHSDESKRKGRWFFVAMSQSAGESGDAMMHQFRLANGLDSKKYSSMFIYPRDIVKQKLSATDTVVFIDDFSGSGKQVCETWNNPASSFGELVAGAGRVYLIVIATTKVARDRISKETSLSVAAAQTLGDKDNFYSEKCTRFSKAEKELVHSYNEVADQNNPKGFGDCGLMIIFCHRCPNNSLPILHREHGDWLGLFPRRA